MCWWRNLTDWDPPRDPPRPTDTQIEEMKQHRDRQVVLNKAKSAEEMSRVVLRSA